MNENHSFNNVERYYNQSSKYYLLFYADSKSLGFHYGFWYDNTKSKQEALINQYREIAEHLQIKSYDRVLDAGCGVGGGSLWLAEKTKAKFDGISISKKQIELANKFSKSRNLDNKTTFHLMDYFKTKFSNKLFDKIFAIESFCYAYPNPIKLYKEMHRILKTKGKIAISDGILLRKPKNPKETAWLNGFCRGWQLNGMCTIPEIKNYLKNAGFRNIRFINRTTETEKSSKIIYRIGIILNPIFTLARWIKLTDRIITDNYYAFTNQRKMYTAGLMGYGIFIAEK